MYCIYTICIFYYFVIYINVYFTRHTFLVSDFMSAVGFLAAHLSTLTATSWCKPRTFSILAVCLPIAFRSLRYNVRTCSGTFRYPAPSFLLELSHALPLQVLDLCFVLFYAVNYLFLLQVY